MIQLLDFTYGPDSGNRLADTSDPSTAGAHAALETFYYALNNRDPAVLRANWSPDPLAQLNNPLGGILRGGDAIAELYNRIFSGQVRIQVTFQDIVEFAGESHMVFAGREEGHYLDPDGHPIPLHIRTSRYFRHLNGQWRQLHHHGSIDDPIALLAYQQSVAQ